MKVTIGIGSYGMSSGQLVSLAQRARNGDIVESQVARIWDRIVDFFCGSHRGEAKQHLWKLYAPEVAASEKVSSFRRLRELVGNAYKGCFQETFGAHKGSLVLSIPDHPDLTWNLNLRDNIADFVCKLERDTVKHHLDRLYATDVPVREKISSFTHLKKLAGEASRSYFSETSSPEKRTYSLDYPGLEWSLDVHNKIFGREELIRSHLTDELNILRITDAEECMRIFAFDGPRAEFTANGKKTVVRADTGTSVPPPFKAFYAETAKMNCNELELASVYSLCGQHNMATLLKAIHIGPNGVPSDDLLCEVMASACSTYEVSRDEEGNLLCSARLYKDIAEHTDPGTLKAIYETMKAKPIFHKSIDMTFTASISQDGHISVLDFQAWATRHTTPSVAPSHTTPE